MPVLGIVKYGNVIYSSLQFPQQQAGLIAQFFEDPTRLIFRQLTAADIHPVAINILNQKRDGKLLIPSPTGNQPLLRGNGTFGQEYLQQQVVPTELKAASGFVSLQHRIGDSNNTRFTRGTTFNSPLLTAPCHPHCQRKHQQRYK